MGWEQRGNNSYYYKKEREGSRVKSVYVGRGEMAHMISQFESSSAELEKLMQAKRSIEANELDRVEAALVSYTFRESGSGATDECVAQNGLGATRQ